MKSKKSVKGMMIVFSSTRLRCTKTICRQSVILQKLLNVADLVEKPIFTRIPCTSVNFVKETSVTQRIEYNDSIYSIQH